MLNELERLAKSIRQTRLKTLSKFAKRNGVLMAEAEIALRSVANGNRVDLVATGKLAKSIRDVAAETTNAVDSAEHVWKLQNAEPLAKLAELIQADQQTPHEAM